MAMSSLQQQLSELKEQQQGFLQPHKQKQVSLLFEKQEAKQIDYETTLNLATNGILSLSHHDPSLSSFLSLSKLFRPEAVQTNRLMLGREENREIDGEIKKLLGRLAPFALLKPTLKVLEFLVRRFLIHLFNVDEFLAFVLPFHQTELFVKVVKISKIKKTRWEFLTPMKKTEAPLPRNLLSRRCVHDLGLLSFILETVQERSEQKNYVSFGCAIICDVLEMAPEIDDSLLHRLLPFADFCFQSPQIDCQSSGFVFLSLLSSRAQLEERVLQHLIKRGSSSSISISLLSSVLSFVGCVGRTQQIVKIEKKGISQIISLPGWERELLSLLEAHPSLSSSLLSLLCRSLVICGLEEEEESDERGEKKGGKKGGKKREKKEKKKDWGGELCGLLRALRESEIREVCVSLSSWIFENYYRVSVLEKREKKGGKRAGKKGEEERFGWVKAVLRLLNGREPSLVDRSINHQFLLAKKSSDSSSDSDSDMSSDSDESPESHPAKPYQQWLLELVTDLYPRSGRHAIQEGDHFVTISLALTHTSQSIRHQALRQLEDFLTSGEMGLGDEKIEVEGMVENVVEMVKDSDQEVAVTAVSILEKVLIGGEEGEREVVFGVVGEKRGEIEEVLRGVLRKQIKAPERDSKWLSALFRVLLRFSALREREESEKGLQEKKGRREGLLGLGKEMGILLFESLVVREDALEFSEEGLRHIPTLQHPLFGSLNIPSILERVKKVKKLMKEEKGKEKKKKGKKRGDEPEGKEREEILVEKELIAINREIVDGVAKGLLAVRGSHFSECVTLIGDVISCNSGFGQSDRDVFGFSDWSGLFGLLVLSRCCSLLSLHSSSSQKGQNETKMLEICLLVLRFSVGQFGAWVVSQTPSESLIQFCNALLTDPSSHFDYILGLAVRSGEEKRVKKKEKGKRDGEKGRLSMKGVWSVLFFCLDTMIRFLPKERKGEKDDSLVLPCHQLFDFFTSLRLLRERRERREEVERREEEKEGKKKKKGRGRGREEQEKGNFLQEEKEKEEEEEQEKKIILSTISTLYIFLLSGPTIQPFLGLIRALIRDHLQEKFLYFNCMIFSAPSIPVFLLPSSFSSSSLSTTSSSASSSPSQEKREYFLTNGNWPASPLIQTRALNQLSLFLSAIGKRIEEEERGEKGKREKKKKKEEEEMKKREWMRGYYSEIVKIFPFILVSLSSSSSVVREAAKHSLSLLSHHLDLFRSSSLLSSDSFFSSSLLSLSEMENALSFCMDPENSSLSPSLEKFFFSTILSYLSFLFQDQEEEKKRESTKDKREKGELVYCGYVLLKFVLSERGSSRLVSLFLPLAERLVVVLSKERGDGRKKRAEGKEERKRREKRERREEKYLYLYGLMLRQYISFSIPFLKMKDSSSSLENEKEAFFSFLLHSLSLPSPTLYFISGERQEIAREIKRDKKRDQSEKEKEQGKGETSIEFCLTKEISLSLSPSILRTQPKERKISLLFSLSSLAFSREREKGSSSARSLLSLLNFSPSIYALSLIRSLPPLSFSSLGQRRGRREEKRRKVSGKRGGKKEEEKEEMSEKEIEKRLGSAGDILRAFLFLEETAFEGENEEEREKEKGIAELLSSVFKMLSVLIEDAKEERERERKEMVGSSAEIEGEGESEERRDRRERGGDRRESLLAQSTFLIQLCLTAARSILTFLRTSSTIEKIGEEKEEQKRQLRQRQKQTKPTTTKKLALEWDQINGDMPVNSLVEYFTETTDLQNNNLSLLLIAEITRSYPLKIIGCVRHIFTYMGSHSLRRDDNYSFMVVQQAIEAIVPALMKADGCGLDTAVEMFVDCLPFIPQHRRLFLFAMFIRVIGIGSLHHLLLQILLRGVRERKRSEEGGKDEREGEEKKSFRYLKFAVDLCSQFSPLQIMRAFGNLLAVVLNIPVISNSSSFSSLALSALPKSFVPPSDRDYLVRKTLGGFSIEERRALRTEVMELGSIYLTSESLLSKWIGMEKAQDKMVQHELLHVFQLSLLHLRQAPVEKSKKGFIDSGILAQDDEEGEEGENKKEESEEEESEEEESEEEDMSDDESEEIESEDEEDSSDDERLFAERREEKNKRIDAYKNIDFFFNLFHKMTMDLVESINELMSIRAFTKAISELLHHPDSSVRHTALRMLNDKIVKAVDHNMLSPVHTDMFLSMIPLLIEMVRLGLAGKTLSVDSHSGMVTKKTEGDDDEQDMSDTDEPPSPSSSSKRGKAGEPDANIQTALLSLEILARHFAASHTDQFAESLSVTIECVSHKSEEVRSSAVISYATHCAEMRANALPSLPKMVPLLVRLLKEVDEVEGGGKMTEEKQLVVMSALSGLEVMVMTVGQFLSPYLVSIVELLIQPLFSSSISAARKMISQKSGSVLAAIAKHIAPRYVFSCVFGVYSPEKELAASSLSRLVGIVSTVLESLSPIEIVQHHKKLLKFFLELFDFRRIVAEGRQQEQEKRKVVGGGMEKLESDTVNGFLKMVVKLNEVSFKPLFLKLLDWACTSPNSSIRLAEHGAAHMVAMANPHRAFVFFRVVIELASTLKAIFSPFFSYVLDHMVSYLLSDVYVNGVQKSKEGKKKKKERKLERQKDVLYHDIILSVLRGLHKLFLYDSGMSSGEGVVDSAVFNKLVSPLTDLLKEYKRRTTNQYNEMVSELVPCLVQLAVLANSDLLWKTMNHNVLMHTRSSLSRVKCGAIQIQLALYERLGEEFLLLLPESISYFSELMEDGDEDVELLCRKLMKNIDSLMGEESIRDYF